MKFLSVPSKQLLIYLVKFFSIFCIAYFGTFVVQALAAPEGKYYSHFIDKYFNYVEWIRYSLLYMSKFFLSIFGYNTVIINDVSLQLVAGRSVHIGYGCIGYGVMFFWLAFMMANNGTWPKKIMWFIGGSVLIWLINIFRICLLLVSLNINRQLPFKMDSHTFFNICAYIVIFIMIYIYDRSEKKKNKKVERVDEIEKVEEV